MSEQTSDIELDLPPEYCHYRDNGCDLADSCLNCPLPNVFMRSMGAGGTG